VTRLFGTDGVRGLANGDLTAELALALATSAATVLRGNHTRPTAVIGRDPRPSGEFLEAAVAAGLARAGVEVFRIGIVPTPAVALLVKEYNSCLGVMISASHNPMPDNGIKFFAAGGSKLTDEQEDAIEAGLSQDSALPTGDAIGRIVDDPAAAQKYLDHIVSTIPADLSGLKVVVDCANGSASVLAPQALRALGAEVIVLNDALDGWHINDNCGSTHPQALQAAVLANGADAGIAHDGDADRCLAVDAQGKLIDGDQIMGILAIAMKQAGTLVKNTLVATVMSNIGLSIALKQAGIELVETNVGDRYVLEQMRAGGYCLGGEQSGHVVMSDYSTTGDGILTALHLLSQVKSTGKPLADLAQVVQPLPQILINVSGVDKSKLASSQDIAEAVAAAQAELGGSGRVLLRPSGTEPVIRVMVEAATDEIAKSVAQALASQVEAVLAL
jgi:phosphoglucosamine mutase